jgi:DNA modification methylase
VQVPVLTEEVFGETGGGRLIQGDSLDVARALSEEGLAGKVDLVYVDPPFASQADYIHEARLDGPADGRVRQTKAYVDSWHTGSGGDGIGAYLDMLAPRLEAMAGLLAPTGTLWVHVDWRAAYLVRVLLDEIVGRGRFVNEIVWRRAPNLGRQAASGQFGRTLDTLVVYGGPRARLTPPTRLEPIAPSSIRHDEEGRPFTTAPRGDYTDTSMARLAREGRVHRTATGKLYVKYFLQPNREGELCRERRVDTLWTDVPPLRHARVSERTGFPTQKPLALLERIVTCASPEGGTVVDLFAGSGTTAEAAHALGRRFIAADMGPVALNVARARLLRAGASFRVQRCGPVATPAAPPPKVIVKRHRSGDVTLDLRSPKEPLAWAVGPVGHPFRAAWHASRIPGATPTPAPHEATLRLPSASAEVRVYADDGTVGVTTCKTMPAMAHAEAP